MSEFECLHFDVDKLPTHFNDYKKDLIQTKLEYMQLTTLSNGPKLLCFFGPTNLHRRCVELWDWT